MARIRAVNNALNWCVGHHLSLWMDGERALEDY